MVTNKLMRQIMVIACAAIGIQAAMRSDWTMCLLAVACGWAEWDGLGLYKQLGVADHALVTALKMWRDGVKFESVVSDGRAAK